MGIRGIHQVYPGKIFIAGKNTVQILAGDIHKAGKTGSGTDKDSFETLLL